MKSFFKKLSLVLVAAMVLTLIPAQNAKAAGAIVLAKQDAKDSTEAITVLDLKKGESQDLKFYGCADWKTTGQGWVSSNEAVATVDNNGVVTAVAAGAAQVCYTATGYTCEAVTVVVADEYDVCIAEQEGTDPVAVVTLKAEDVVDYRFLGAKGYDTKKHQCTWISTNEAVATVDKKGVVTAVADGDAKIVLTIVDKATGAVAFAVAPLNVTVKTAKLEAKQTAWNKAEVTFNDAAVDASKLEVESIAYFAGEEIEVIKEYVDVNGKEVTFYNNIINGQKYVFTYNGQKVEFIGNVGKLADFDITYSSKLLGNGAVANNVAYADQDVTIKKANFVDANGVKVNTAGFTYEYEDKYMDGDYEVVTNFFDDQELFIADKTSHVVTITVYDANNQKLMEKSVNIVATPAPAFGFVTKNFKLDTVAGAKLYCQIENGTDFRLSIDDLDSYGLAFCVTDTYGNIYESKVGQTYANVMHNDPVVGNVETDLSRLGQFEFESSNPNVLSVTDNGILEAQSEGRATIFCYFEWFEDGDKDAHRDLLQAIPFQVVGHLVPTTVTMDVTSNMFASTGFTRIADLPGACDFDKSVVTFTAKDQLGRNIVCDVTAKIYDQNTGKQITATEFANRFENTACVWNAANDNYDVTLTGGKLNVEAHNVTSTLAVVNTRFDFTLSKNGKAVKKTLNVSEFNLEKATKAPEAGVVWCRLDKLAGIGHTDTNDKTSALYVDAHVVDVYTASGAYVYGENVTDTAVNTKSIADYQAVKSLSLTELKAYADARIATIATTVFVQALVDGKEVGFTTPTPAGHTSVIRFQVRKSIAGLDSDVKEAAKKLAAIAQVTADVNIWTLNNSNPNNPSQPSTTWNRRSVTKYDTAALRTLKNNDDARFAAKLVINDLYYLGDIPAPTAQAIWQEWFKGHTDLFISWDAKLATIKDDKDNDAVDATNTKYAADLVEFTVNYMNANTKYIQSIECWFKTDDADALVYKKINVGKKVTNYDYAYKNETGIEGEGR